jgi:hypothetical protein
MKTLFTSLVLAFIAPLFLFAQKVSTELLSMYDINMKCGVEAGTVKVYVGTNSVVVQGASCVVSE